MNAVAITVLAILGIAYGAFALPALSEFRTFCDQIVESTDHREKPERFWYVHDSTMSNFERVQFGRLLRGDYTHVTDPSILVLARRLTSRLRLVTWTGIALVIFVVATAGVMAA